MLAATRLEIDAVAFDVFGTLVDWRSGIITAARRIGEAAGVTADWARLADAWRAKYRPALDRVRHGEAPWQNFTALHRQTLTEVLTEQGITGLDERHQAELTAAWSRLPAWPDSVSGLSALRSDHLVATLSNGHMGLLARLVKHAGLPIDLVLSAELAGSYKPAPEVYQTAARLLDLPTERVLMTAAHPYDLHAAAAAGMRTAYLPRPDEWGRHGPAPEPPDPVFDLVVHDIDSLAAQLTARPDTPA